MVPWGFQDDFDSPIVSHHSGDSSQILKHNAFWQNQIEMVRKAGFKVFYKPHLWIDKPSNGTWRSDVFPANDDNWELWKSSYSNFIFRYAKVAELAQAEMFCIGTEFSRLAIEKPIFWRKLIKEIRAIYSGKIIYGANWYNEFEEISFWDQLDYIGIQAYFPLVNNEHPSVEQLSKGWKKHVVVDQNP